MTRSDIHALVERLPASEFSAAHRFLTYLCDMQDPITRALLAAPWDDESWTDEDRRELEPALDQIRRGETVSLKDILEEFAADL